VNRYSAIDDRKSSLSQPGSGMDCSQLWMCGHRSVHGVNRYIAGGGRIPWRCKACADVKKPKDGPCNA
jgi:hypothetical protein